MPVEDPAVNRISDVPALNVSPVDTVPILKHVPVPDRVIILLPKLIVLVFVLFERKFTAFIALLAVVSVPKVKVKEPEAILRVSPSVTVIPLPFIVRLPQGVFPAVVSVPVPFRVSVPLYVTVIPATSVTLPDTVMAAVPANVPVNPVQLIDCAPVLPVEMVQVPVDRFVKNTASADVGTLAPPAPPDVVAHLVPAVPSQAAVPPTQKRSAILALLKFQRLVPVRV